MIANYLPSVLVYFGLLLLNLTECTVINCNEKDECYEAYFICEDDEECVVNCTADGSCRRSHIECPVDQNCVVSCVANNDISESICKDLTVNATLSTYLRVDASSNWETLRSAIIHCPFKGKCDLNGDGKHIMTFMDIYAIQGFRDLNIQCKDCYLGDLYCTESFYERCHIDSSNNQCHAPCNSLYKLRETGHQGQICNDYILSIPSAYPSQYPSSSPSSNPSHQSINPSVNPSTNPSINPSRIPSINPSNNPTINPTIDPTIDPSIDPSIDPTINPTVHPTVNPTIDPSIDPTINPTIDPSINPSIDPSIDPSINPTTNPSINPSFHPSMNPSTENVSILCDNNNCDDDNAALSVDLSFSLSPDIMYNDDNLNCFMFSLLFAYFDDHFDFGSYFFVCNTRLESINGGQHIDGNCNGNTPCFMHSNVNERVLLESETDGEIVVSMVAHKEDVLSTLQNAKYGKLEIAIADAFSSNFLLSMDVIVSANDEVEVINPKKEDNNLREDKSDDELMGHFSGTRDQKICVGTFLGLLSILFPFEIYYTLRLYRARYSPFIHARHPTLNTVINLIAALFLMIERPMHAVHRLSVYNELWFQWMRLTFYFFAMQFLLGGVVLRFWLLLFEVKWTISMRNKEWQKHINAALSSKTGSFWVRAHKTWGNISFVWKYIVTICILLGAIPVFVVYSSTDYFYGSMAHGMLLGSGVLILYILWRTTPIFHDEFKIMEECGFVVTWIGVAILMDLSFTSLKIIFGEKFWIWFLSYSMPFLLLSGVMFIQSYWVLAEMKRSKQLNSLEAYKTKLNLELSQRQRNESLSDTDAPLAVESMSLYELIADKMGCNEFIAHLLKEFSFENILSIIEMTQYKECFIKWKEYHQEQDDYKEDNNAVESDDSDNADNNLELLRSDSDNSIDAHGIELYGEPVIKLPRNLPRSSIVWNIPIELAVIQDFRNIAKMLYTKYIKLGSELELNISFKLRKETTQKLNEIERIDELKLYTFFDDIIDAIFKLMQDSYSRFRMTRGFVKYESSFLHRRHSVKNSLHVKIKKKLSPHVSVSS